MLTPTSSDERNFVRPDEFIPERWSTQPHLILNSEAFIPFSVGVYSCPGKAFAMMEIRMVISSIVSMFNITVVPSWRSEQRHNPEASDCYVIHIPATSANFEIRIAHH